MTTPPEITDEHVALLADLHAVITQAIEDTPYVLGTPVGPFAAVITADVAAYMGRQVIGVTAELDAARRAARASEESATILQRSWDAQAAEWNVTRVERDEARRQLAAVAAQRDRLREQLAGVQEFADRDQDGLCCSHVQGELRRLLAARTAT